LTTPPRPDELSRTLHRLRTDSGMTTTELARRAGMSRSTVSRLERGLYVPTPEQAEAMARAVDATAVERRRVVALATDVRARTAPRQVLIRGGGANAQRKFGEIEAAAGHVQSFSPVMVVGLLQTPDYARVVFREVLPPEQVDDAVLARQARQLVLDDPSGPALTQVMTEGALRWCVGSADLMADQCSYLAERAASERDGVRIGVIPWERGAEVFPMNGFDVYDRRAAIVGTVTGTAFLTARGDVDAYASLFESLTALAVFGDEAAALFRRIGDDYRAI
jgi:transcriptional regulator with XRE-family HTH domain